MKELFKKLVEKETKLIEKPIIIFLEERLLGGFKTKQGNKVVQIKSLFALPYVDEDLSSFKEEIVITRVDVQTDVMVDFENGLSTNNLALSIYNKFIIKYNNDNKKYYIENIDDIKIVDVTMY